MCIYFKITCAYNFRPAGWDNDSKITILNEHIKTFDSNENFADRIVKPVSRKVDVTFKHWVGVNVSWKAIYKCFCSIALTYCAAIS